MKICALFIFGLIVFLLTIRAGGPIFNWDFLRRGKYTPRPKEPDMAEGLKSAYRIAVENGFLGSEQQWHASLPRKGRRELEFAEETPEQELERNRRKQKLEYEAFLKKVETLEEAGKIHRWSVFTFTKNVLHSLGSALADYRINCTKEGIIENCIPLYEWVLMKKVSHSILTYSDGNGLQTVAVDLIKFVEKHYKLHGLTGVLYRHKGHILYETRCENMSLAILRHFSGHVPTSVMLERLCPLDYAVGLDLTPVEAFRRSFFHEAIDGTYISAMRQSEKNSYVAATRKDAQEHERNRRQRSKRLSKNNRKGR